MYTSDGKKYVPLRKTPKETPKENTQRKHAEPPKEDHMKGLIPREASKVSPKKK